MSERHLHMDPADMFSEPAWEERYRGATAVWSGRPNPQLVAEAADLPVGSALEVGCGEGADAIWLAARGWRVTAVDFATAALERAAAHAAERGPDVAARIDFRHADLRTWEPDRARYDLVSAQFMHLPEADRVALFARLAAAVAPGGTLLLVGHHPADMAAGQGHGHHVPGMFYTAEEVAGSLDDGWEVVAADARPRSTTLPDGVEATIHDAVLRARRR